MPSYRINVYVKLKPGILDPQGQAIHHALQSLGFTQFEQVHTGKFFELSVSAENAQAAEAVVRKACEKLLANPVIEDYSLTTVGEEESAVS
ncbi:MAG: phosphoribosylformylglycinamidine synthase subunit PurS [Calditrichaeota bacterium]|nr:MAG: phosphoribosylformylglycinamidine synthase subunit PurS [Calditrichota bacterium]